MILKGWYRFQQAKEDKIWGARKLVNSEPNQRSWHAFLADTTRGRYRSTHQC